MPIFWTVLLRVAYVIGETLSQIEKFLDVWLTASRCGAQTV